MNKLRELIILYPTYESGGATKNLINFINYCSTKNLKLTLISNLKNKKQFFKKENIRLITLKKGLFSKYGGRYISSFYSIIKLAFIINKKNKSNTIVFSFQSHIIPILFCKISAYLSLFLKFIFYRFANGIITNSSKSKKSLQKIVKKKIQLIFNPYLKSLYIFKFKKRKKYILSVGRLCKQKNQVIIIKAFKIFLKTFPDYKLILVGHGIDYSKLKRLVSNLGIEKNVRFLGFVKNVKKLYLSSKIFVFPSLYEGLPNALIDTVNFNLPPISSKCSGAQDILGKNFDNFVSRNNFENLSTKMISVINNYSVSLNQLQKSRKKLNRFLISTQSIKYLNFCEKILQKK